MIAVKVRRRFCAAKMLHTYKNHWHYTNQLSNRLAERYNDETLSSIQSTLNTDTAIVVMATALYMVSIRGKESITDLRDSKVITETIDKVVGRLRPDRSSTDSDRAYNYAINAAQNLERYRFVERAINGNKLMVGKLEYTYYV